MRTQVLVRLFTTATADDSLDDQCMVSHSAFADDSLGFSIDASTVFVTTGRHFMQPTIMMHKLTELYRGCY
jgi:hypothetical protein